ncbi:MAG: YihY/virulence factor BrkB family protein [Candidatus Paceibacteria bacterium]
MQKLKRVLKSTLINLYKDGSIGHSAAMSFYVVLALPVFLLIALSLGGLLWNTPEVQNQIIASIPRFTGLEDTEIIKQLLDQTLSFNASLGAIYSVILLVLTSSAIFTYLHQALNEVFGVEVESDDIVRLFLLRRAIAFLMMLFLGLLFIVNLVAQGIISFGFSYVDQFIYLSGSVLAGLNTAIGLVILFILFYVIFRVVPDVKLSWRDAGIGAVVTTFLFALGKNLIGWYIAQSTLSTAYGAAGSLVVFLLWVYYSSLILFFGAEFTESYALDIGDGIEPKKEASFTLEKHGRHGLFSGISKFISDWYENR